ncbi:hypothetical protein Vafri_16368 [Volvox africanus]|uniref:Uncharacterized protein n=1 Tax=Volvox africanus TaxID=51714 RepID=A0A8J4BIP4_9CHLO|nr:hypothetical protein Vafri_16368 [Volvox africanus]
MYLLCYDQSAQLSVKDTHSEDQRKELHRNLSLDLAVGPSALPFFPPLPLLPPKRVPSSSSSLFPKSSSCGSGGGGGGAAQTTDQCIARWQGWGSEEHRTLKRAAGVEEQKPSKLTNPAGLI